MKLSKWRANIWQILAFGLAIIPAGLTGILILKYSVNVPNWDEWFMAEMFEKIYAGSLTFQDLISQHNESRKLFPRILFIGLAYLTGWDVRYQMLVSFILACFISFSLYRLSRLTVGGSSTKLILLAFLANLLIFSPSQQENWLWGIQVVVFVPITCIVACILVAYSNLSLRNQVLIGIILSTVATFSYANGLLCWAIVFPVFALAKFQNWKDLMREKWLIGAGLVGFVSNVVVYFYNYKKPPATPSFAEGVLHPVKALNYFLAFLGAPLAGGSLTIATIVGVILVGSLIICCVYIGKFREQKNLINRTLGWLAIAGYTIISAAITASGRVGFGVEQSLSSRYATFAVYLAIPLIYLITIVLEDAAARGLLTRHNLTLNRVLSSVLTLFILLHGIAIDYGIDQMGESQVGRNRGKTCLTFVNVVNTDHCLIWLWNDPNDKQAQAYLLNIMKARGNILNRMGFLKPKLATSNKIEEIKGQKVAGLDYGSLNSMEPVGKDKYAVRGWAILPEKVKPADGVILTYENQHGESIIFAIAAVELKRRDIAKVLGNKAYSKSGWEKVILANQIPPKAGTIKAWALDADTGKAFKLKGNFTLISVSRDNQQPFPVLVETASLSFLGAIGCRSPVAESIARG
jgi:hypothetical protein